MVFLLPAFETNGHITMH